MTEMAAMPIYGKKKIKKNLHLWNLKAWGKKACSNGPDWSQISCGVAMGWDNASEYKCFITHDQDGRHAHIW